ncbi:hypothetical protein BSKO_00400 [Bryopsis sp. KO-2023]|nr:hypothetical protein BSKO_00400 [Bryopsis sp. KO-2023]
MQGALFRYGEESPQLAFQSNLHTSHVVLVGGLTDGLIPVPYTELLSTTLDSMGWSLVQAQLSSAYQGYGVGSLDRDAKELAELAAHLKAERGCQRIVIIGHSTGCQDLVRYVKQNHGNGDLPPLAGAILQAPVSDREDAERYPSTIEHEEMAKKLVSEGKGEEIVIRDFVTSIGTPLTANRFMALYSRKGDDDMFSSYFSEQELKELLQHMKSTRSLVLVSGKEEYVPEWVNVVDLGGRIAQAMGPNAILKVVDDAVHNLQGHEQQGVTIMAEFIRSLG